MNGDSALPNLFSRRFVDDPFATYRYLRETAPVRRIHREGVPMWLVTGYEPVRRVLTDQRFVKDPERWPVPLEQIDPGLGAIRTIVGEHLLYSDPPRHTVLRKLVSKAFVPRRIADFEPIVETIVGHLLDRFDRHDEIDLVAWYAVPIGVTVICEILGIPAADRRDFRRWSVPLVSDEAGAAGEARRAAIAELTGYLEALIDGKRRRPGPDLLSDLIAARDGDQRLDDRELVSMALLLLVAGHETTINLIGNAALTLLRHPDQADLLRRRPDLLPDAVEELVRYEGSVIVCTLRITREPVELAGVPIGAGEVVMAVVGAADRDPERFPDPDRFDIGRAAGAHLGFGAGIHYCVGAPLARMQLRVALQALLSRFPAMTLAIPADQVPWHASVSVRGPVRLPVAPRGMVPAGAAS